MITTFIIIRGNSGSGKSTLAGELRYRLKDAMVISQDVIRREILNVKDTWGNHSINLIKMIASYGDGLFPFVIVEGIMVRERYGQMLMELKKSCSGIFLPVYLDVTFKETILRNQNKSDDQQCAVSDMSRWWVSQDSLSTEREIIFNDSHTISQMVSVILNDLSREHPVYDC